MQKSGIILGDLTPQPVLFQISQHSQSVLRRFLPGMVLAKGFLKSLVVQMSKIISLQTIFYFTGFVKKLTKNTTNKTHHYRK